jgi:hypothetical protein
MGKGDALLSQLVDDIGPVMTFAIVGVVIYGVITTKLSDVSILSMHILVLYHHNQIEQ